MDDKCKHVFRDGASCRERLHQDSELCFWHDPQADKSGPEIKAMIEEKHQRGDTLESILLNGAQLENVRLSRANLHNAQFKRANLRNAHLFGADLTRANLFKAALHGANMKEAMLSDAELLGAALEETKLPNGGFGGPDGYTVKNEIEGRRHEHRGEIEPAHEKYFEAEEIYRAIKRNLKDSGMSFAAGDFFFKEMEMNRKQMPIYSLNRFWSKLMSVSTGYGEKPHRIFCLSLTYIVLSALLFFCLGIRHTSGHFLQYSSSASLIENLEVFYDALYFSLVTFITLGYGDYTPVGIGKLFAMMEAFLGAFSISLFSISTYKRYMDR